MSIKFVSTNTCLSKKANHIVVLSSEFSKKTKVYTHLLDLFGEEITTQIMQDMKLSDLEKPFQWSSILMGHQFVHELKVYKVSNSFKNRYSDWLQLFGNVSRDTFLNKSLDIHITVGAEDALDLSISESFSEGLIKGSYQFKSYQVDFKPKKTANYSISIAGVDLSDVDEKNISKLLKKGEVVANSVNQARTLSNTPANILTPTHFLTQIQSLKNIELEIIDEKKAKKLNMGGFLAVSQGSVEPGYMVVANYKGAAKKSPTIGIVGKGVTFDSGGISIKPSRGMSSMKGDMGGAAAVYGLMNALSILKLKVNVTAVFGLVENMPSHVAYKPGDLITMHNGKTVEVTNTDAEGRMVMADALSYLATKQVDYLVDIATLTGACSISLGDVAAGICTTSDFLGDFIVNKCGSRGERFWRLPMYDEFFEYLKSDVADMINANENRLAGTSTAAVFLKQFVSDIPWVHIDIASVMSHKTSNGANVKGMSGFGVRTLVDLVEFATGK